MLRNFYLNNRAGTSAVASPLRGVSASNRIASGSATTSGVRLGAAMKDLHYIGTAAVTELRVSINNWGLGGYAGTNAFTIPEMWITVVGESSGYAVKWAASTSTTVPIGEVDYQSDIITPEHLGFSGSIPRGTQLYIGYRAEVTTAGHKFPTTAADRNPTTNSSIIYEPNATVISNLQGSSAMSWAGGSVSASNDAARPPIMLLGKFVGGDQASFMGIGDSITDGTGTGSDGIGFFYQSLFDNFASRTLPIAGILCSQVGSNSTQWTDNALFPGQPARLAAIAKYANIAVERYGVNTLASGHAAILADRQTLWAAFRTANTGISGGRTPKIIALELTPYTTSTDAWATFGNQTVVANAGAAGGNLDLLDQAITALVGAANGPDIYFDNTATARGTGADYWKWAASSTQDGLHPITARYTAMADDLRATMQAQL